MDSQLPKEKIKKGIELMKNELGGKIMTEFAVLKAKWFSYWKDENDEGKKVKGIKMRIKKT